MAKWDGNRSRVKFQYPWILELYIARSIEEEIREKVPSSALQGGKLKIPRDLLINQRLLTCGASNSMVLLLLRDAVNDKRLTTKQLMKLIELSRERGVEQDGYRSRNQPLCYVMPSSSTMAINQSKILKP